MVSFDSINDMIDALSEGKDNLVPHKETYKEIIMQNRDLFEFLKFLETANPCHQKYFLFKKVIFISYTGCKDILKPGRHCSIKFRFRIIGMPVSLPNPGYLTAEGDEETRSNIAGIIKEAVGTLKGTTIVLNADTAIKGGQPALSNFIFYNEFSGFQDYLESLRSGYRRKIKYYLERGRKLTFTRLGKGCFTRKHYDLYLSVCKRAAKVMRIMPYEYFRDCDADVYEVKDEKSRLLAILQLKAMDGVLYFLYVGFKQEDEWRGQPDIIRQIDLYYNLLLFIIKLGIEGGYSKIVFGQTSAESKSKVGCREENKYIWISSKNPFVSCFLKLFPGLYRFKPYSINHRVFKD